MLHSQQNMIKYIGDFIIYRWFYKYVWQKLKIINNLTVVID